MIREAERSEAVAGRPAMATHREAERSEAVAGRKAERSEAVARNVAKLTASRQRPRG